jgi:Cadherin domain
MRLSPIAFVGSAGQAPISFAGSFPVSHGATDSPIGSVGLSDISDTNAAANAVIENAANGAAVGITAFAVEPGETVTYTLTANPGGLFAVNLTTGVVTKAAALDAETAGNHNITVRATSTSGKTNDRAFSITVNDFDEFNVGVVTDTNGAANEVIESAANGSTVGITALATDLDVSDTVTYSLSDDAGGRFAIDSDTGVVTVADTGLLDFETETSHDITVLATSSDASTTPQNFTIAILNDVADDGLVPATRFEGTSTVLRRAANPTGAADGVNGTFAIPIKMMGDADPFDTKLQYIWSNETGSYIRRNADGKVEALFADSAGVERAKIISTNELEVGDGWVMLLVNPDKMYFGNTDETGTRTTGAATDIDWTSGFNWGEDSAGGNRGNFEIARPWLALEAYDLTLQANRDKFFTALTPLDLADIKTDGSGPTGTQALDLLPNGYSAVSQNAGSGGNYSTVGTPREGTGPAGAALTSGRTGLTVLGEAQVWWAVDDVENTITGGNVETLANKGIGGTVNATQAIASQRPVETDTAGVISAEYDAMDDLLVAAAAQFPANFISGGGTVVFVARPDTGGNGRLYGKRNTNLFLSGDGGAGLQINYWISHGGGTSTSNSGADDWPDGTIGILDVRLDGAALTAVSDIRMFLNGTQLTLSGSGYNSGYQDESAHDLALGNRAEADRTLDGALYEVAFWNTELSDTDMAFVRSHLATKYGVTLP